MYLPHDISLFHFGSGIVIALIALTITCLKWRFAFWKRNGLPCAKTTSSFGGLTDFLTLKKGNGEYFADIYREAKSRKLKHIGAFFFLKPAYVPIDLDIIKQILTKDFNNFMDRGVYFNLKDDPLSGHLFSLEGEPWRRLRHKLSPTFTSGQMKLMFPTLVDCGEKFRKYMSKISSDEAVDIKDALARLTTDIIGSCAFGIQCNSLENPDAEFRKYGKMLFDIDYVEFLRAFANFTISQRFLRFIHMRVIKTAVSKFFMNAVKETVDYREKEDIHRKDFMQLLIQLKNGETGDLDQKHGTITMEELAAQAFVFYLAGFETSSTAMTFTLYELALNQHIQDKLREEIRTILGKHEGKFTYEAAMEMHYMQQVIDESLRKYPPVPFLQRICIEKYKIPGTDLVLPKGVEVKIAVLGLHYDEEYYPEPEKFDPDRFSEDNKKKLPRYSYLAFGEGQRNCIGSRFGILQSKIGLTSLLRDYRVTLHERTTVPMELDKATFVLTSKTGVWLKLEKLQVETA